MFVKNSLKYNLRGPIHTLSAMGGVLTRRRKDGKPLSEQMIS